AAQEYYHDFELAAGDFTAYLANAEKDEQHANLKPGYVPQTIFWLVKDGRTVLGESHLRHYLNPALELFGGHIGYRIRPSARRSHYGTTLLAMTLVKARELGLQRVLVTCDDTNTGSYRIIESNGGILLDKLIPPEHGILIRRYWIDILPANKTQ
ncbi:MAG: GNAT family N-acetyltransferase, partial [Anaerolineaceae bacterium]|nr:GNAT family N-acetyltransferase [Anaerolineaceae bacterium]